MKILRILILFTIFGLFGGLRGPCQSISFASESVLGQMDSADMVVTSDQLELDDIQKTVTFSGNVDAKREDFSIACDKLRVFYEQSSKETEIDKEKTKIKKIVATGKVKITRSEGGIATAEKAVYFQDEEMVVLTGNPKAEEERGFVEGDRITIYVKENRSVIQGSQEKKVKAVIFQDQEER